VIRAATADDARAIAELLTGTWQRAYADFISVADMPDADTREARLRERLGAEDRWVFDLDGRIAAFAAIEPATGELAALYVEPAAQGAGLGDTMLRHAEAALREAGRRHAHLWVFEANGHGRAFYERRGWALDPEGRSTSWAAPAVRYRKSL
jgi:ribosomal protein S18 acetylase RimI-like enzyme